MPNKQVYLFPIHSIPKGSKILLYGAGCVGQQYQEQLRLTGYAEIVQWADQKMKNYKYLIEKVDDESILITPEDINPDAFDYAVIAIDKSLIAEEIEQFLIDKGIPKKKIVWYDKFPERSFEERYRLKIVDPAITRIKRISKRREKIKGGGGDEQYYLERLPVNVSDKFILPRITIVLTKQCTLNCKECSNVMPGYHSPIPIPAEMIVSDIDRLFSSIDGCVTIELIGGEPFIYRDIDIILKRLIKQENLLEIEIASNGTIAPSDELCEILKNDKIFIRFSRYSVVKNFQNTINKIKQYGINYQSNDEMVWKTYGSIKKYNRDKEVLKYMYDVCFASHFCQGLFKGKIYTCTRSSSYYDLGYVNDPSGYVDIYKVKDLRKALLDFYTKDINVACDYCNVVFGKPIPAGEQAK